MNQPNYPDDPMRVAPPYCAPGEREPEEITDAERAEVIDELVHEALKIRPSRSIYDRDGRDTVIEALAEGMCEVTPLQLQELTDAIYDNDDNTSGRVIREVVIAYLRRGAEKRADEHIERRRQRAA